MKTRSLLVAALLFCISLAAFAQKRDLLLYVKDGSLKTTNTITPARIDSFNKHTVAFKNKIIAVLQFENLPDEAIKKELAANGIELLEYIPQNAYTVSLTGKLQASLLQRWGVRTVTE